MQFASIHLTLLVSLKYYFFLKNNGLFFPHPNVGFAEKRAHRILSEI